LSLPPPKTKAKLAAGSQPKKFVLDLPKPGRSLANAALEGEPAKKKARTEGGGEGFGIDGLLPEPKRTAGLGALLPAPKAASLPANDGKAGEVKEKAAVSLIPHTLKGKGKALPKKVADESDTAHVGAEKPAAVDSDADFFGLSEYKALQVCAFMRLAEDAVLDDGTASVPTHEPAIDFFGLGGSSASTVKLSTSISTSKPSISAAPSTSTTVKNKISISSAPSTSAPSIASNYYATLPLPTPSDPYPGFYQLPSGQWAAKRPDEWEIWAKAQGWGQQDQPTQAEVPPEEPELPKDFEQVGIDRSVEVNAVKLRGQGGDTNARPSKIPEEDRIKAEEEAARAKVSGVLVHKDGI